MLSNNERPETSQVGGGQPSQPRTPKTGLPTFNSYISSDEVKQKVKKGELIEGVLRINPKNYEDAYISAPGGGTDIYIGGVRDRNAALHGDLIAIELMDPQYWKVLYEQLDYFLDSDETLKKIVYSKDDAFAIMDKFIPPVSLTCSIVKDEKLANVANDKLEENESNCSTVISGENDVPGKTDKKKTRRNKKKLKKGSDGDPLLGAAEEIVSELLSGADVVQNVKDELCVISSNLSAESVCSDNAKPHHGKKKKKKKHVVVVPPDMLSECSDVSDCESCCSDTLDLDTALEDRSFFNAQRTAAASEEEAVAATADQPSSSNTGPVKIVDITDDPVQVQKLQAKQEAEQKKSIEKDESQKKQTKRISTAERLFGDKLRQQNSSKADRKQGENKSSPKVDKLIADMHIQPKESTEVHASPIAICVSSGTPSIKLEDVKSEGNPSGVLAGFPTDNIAPHINNATTPPRFMVSPYNQQVNFSPGQSRAENNWFNHPMMNKFGNAPPQTGYQSPGRYQQPHQQQQQYQQQHQYQHQKNRQHNSQSCNNRSQPHNQNRQCNNNNRQRQNQQPCQSNRLSGHQEQKRTIPCVAQVMRLSNWSRYIQKVGYVVHINEQRNTRLGAGTLKPFADMNTQFALFSPNDGRIPRMKIPMEQCPSDLFIRRQDYAKKIYLAKIAQWTDFKFAIGALVRDIGQQGEIEAESEAFLLQIGIDYSNFSEEVTADLPIVPSTGWVIPPEAMEGRKDLRDECIFSIDPATARDLDDALSCVALSDGGYEVGVHIADVAHFVPLNSELDKCAADRGTSVYLVNKVVPMLPRLLCEQLCSLNPNEDRLAFSVVWKMDSYGQVQSTWFGRTIIRSCCKLSYDHAQSVLNNPEKNDWTPEELAPISVYSVSEICKKILQLHQLSKHMRNRRYNNGALRLDQKKLSFALNKDTKLPEAVQSVDMKDSNRLIEEFMLLANISVAHKIYESFPKQAILRCHPEPQVGLLHDTAALLRTFDVEINTMSAGSVYESIQDLIHREDFSPAQQEVVINMLSKPMQTALYFCPATYEEDFSHYALNVPFYTHFTSPIRRYPDVMVHRLLAAAIDLERYPVPQLEEDEIDRRISKANEKKMSAKRASEHSGELYLAEFVRQVREIETKGVVIGVLDRSLDILLLDFCTIKRAYLEKLPLDELNFDTMNKNDPPFLHVVWSPDHHRQLPPSAQSFTYFTMVDVLLTPFTNDQLKFNVTLIRPES